MKKAFNESKKGMGFLVGILAVLGMMFICRAVPANAHIILPYLMTLILAYCGMQGGQDGTEIATSKIISKAFHTSKKATGYCVGVMAMYALAIMFKDAPEMIKLGLPYILTLALAYIGIQGGLDIYGTVKKATNPVPGGDNGGIQEQGK